MRRVDGIQDEAVECAAQLVQSKRAVISNMVMIVANAMSDAYNEVMAFDAIEELNDIAEAEASLGRKLSPHQHQQRDANSGIRLTYVKGTIAKEVVLNAVEWQFLSTLPRLAEKAFVNLPGCCCDIHTPISLQSTCAAHARWMAGRAAAAAGFESSER